MPSRRRCTCRVDRLRVNLTRPGRRAAGRRSAPLSVPAPVLLAQQDLMANLPRYLVFMGLVIVAVGVLVAVLIVARRLLGRGKRFDLDEGFTIGDLRRLHRDGQITEDEFNRAKASVAARGQQFLLGGNQPSGSRPAPAPPADDADVDPDEAQADSDNDSRTD